MSASRWVYRRRKVERYFTAETYSPVAEDKGLKLELQSESCLIQGDFDLVVEAVVNLIENAVKFTPANATINVSVFLRNGRSHMRIAPIASRSGAKRLRARSILANDLNRSLANYPESSAACGFGSDV